jgi:hypothetical protein
MDTDKHGLEKRWRATAVQDLAEMQNGSTCAKRFECASPLALWNAPKSDEGGRKLFS